MSEVNLAILEASPDQGHEIITPAEREISSSIPDLPPLEEIASKTYQSSVVRSINALLDGDAIYEDPDSRWYPLKFEPEKSIPILEAVKASEPIVEVAKNEPISQDELQLMLFVQYEKTVASLQALGIVPAALAKLIETRLLSSKNIRTTDASTAHFSWDSYSFAAEPGADFMFGTGCVTTFEQKILDAANNTGLQLPASDVREVAVRMIVSHEYGHAVDTAVKMLVAEKKGTFASGLDDEDFDTFNRVIEPEFTESIARNEEIIAMFPDALPEASKSSNERISTGFELLALRSILEEKGVSKEDIISVVANLQQQEHVKAQEYAQLFKRIKEKGYPLSDFRSGLGALRGYLEAVRPDLKQFVLYHLGGRSIGYSYPISQQQLEGYIDTFYHKDQVEQKLTEQKGGEE